jgi:hypothetical protein
LLQRTSKAAETVEFNIDFTETFQRICRELSSLFIFSNDRIAISSPRLFNEASVAHHALATRWLDGLQLSTASLQLPLLFFKVQQHVSTAILTSLVLESLVSGTINTCELPSQDG